MARLTDITKMNRMRLALENKMLSMTVNEFKSFIMKNGNVEEDEDEFVIFIPKGENECVKGKTYDLSENDFKGALNEFIITEDDRIFLAVSLNERVEVVESEDSEESEDLEESKSHNMTVKDLINVLIGNEDVEINSPSKVFPWKGKVGEIPSRFFNHKIYQMSLFPVDERKSYIIINIE